MKKTSPTSIHLDLGENHSPDKIQANTKRICNWNGTYYRAVETKDFIYFVNYREGDDNGNTMMYRKDGLELVCNNYFASNDLFELMVERPEEITYLSRTAKENMKLIQEEYKD
jgi:hypothetical protein